MSYWEDKYIKLCKFLGVDYVKKYGVSGSYWHKHHMQKDNLKDLNQVIDESNNLINTSALFSLAFFSIELFDNRKHNKLSFWASAGIVCYLGYGLMVANYNKILAKRQINRIKKEQLNQFQINQMHNQYTHHIGQLHQQHQNEIHKLKQQHQLEIENLLEQMIVPKSYPSQLIETNDIHEHEMFNIHYSADEGCFLIGYPNPLPFRCKEDALCFIAHINQLVNSENIAEFKKYFEHNDIRSMYHDFISELGSSKDDTILSVEI